MDLWEVPESRFVYLLQVIKGLHGRRVELKWKRLTHYSGHGDILRMFPPLVWCQCRLWCFEWLTTAEQSRPDPPVSSGQLRCVVVLETVTGRWIQTNKVTLMWCIVWCQQQLDPVSSSKARAEFVVRFWKPIVSPKFSISMFRTLAYILEYRAHCFIG